MSRSLLPHSRAWCTRGVGWNRALQRTGRSETGSHGGRLVPEQPQVLLCAGGHVPGGEIAASDPGARGLDGIPESQCPFLPERFSRASEGFLYRSGGYAVFFLKFGQLLPVQFVVLVRIGLALIARELRRLLLTTVGFLECFEFTAGR